MTLHIALYQPEIPPNTGNIQRLCANTGAILHLIRPLGFSLREKTVRRAGMDYQSQLQQTVHNSYRDFQAHIANLGLSDQVVALTTGGNLRYSDYNFKKNQVLLFGPETRGLPKEILENIAHDQRLAIPMQPKSRSLNLSNAVAITLYEAWRQLDFSPLQREK